ncbi:hypothetical protein ASG01_11695 [Chryseobacterium sp. Leaf180]|uniref:hypothetical protein n=1 Tax=Chryseobacterium sp. Leaf180 TaxID=1736289 RepID=UPI0006FFB1F0|nr:hypothetical protein [Chryseobacterium sp. Leaf180]KQR92567.1 hypothetical protein ASG01_11695 [Chryseobacterium sp. Leaf180]
MKRYIWLFVLIFSCQKKPEKTTIKPVEEKISASQISAKISPEKNIKQLSYELINALKSENYVYFSSKIHPEKGVRFSMYAFINQKRDKVFTKEDFDRYIKTNILFTWGEKDGSGELYRSTLQNYVSDWIMKKDFSKSQMLLNKSMATGNSLNNTKDAYPNAEFVEFYIPGTEKHSKMDWFALRFVYEKYDGKYFLVGIVNDQWTI